MCVWTLEKTYTFTPCTNSNSSGIAGQMSFLVAYKTHLAKRSLLMPFQTRSLNIRTKTIRKWFISALVRFFRCLPTTIQWSSTWLASTECTCKGLIQSLLTSKMGEPGLQGQLSLQKMTSTTLAISVREEVIKSLSRLFKIVLIRIPVELPYLPQIHLRMCLIIPTRVSYKKIIML